MTDFGLYLVIVNLFGILATFYYIGQGGVEYTRGILIFSGLWAIVNTLGIIYFGTGTGI